MLFFQIYLIRQKTVNTSCIYFAIRVRISHWENVILSYFSTNIKYKMFSLASGSIKQKLLEPLPSLSLSHVEEVNITMCQQLGKLSELYETLTKCIWKSFLDTQKYPKSTSDFAFFLNIKRTFFPVTLVFMVFPSLAFL